MTLIDIHYKSDKLRTLRIKKVVDSPHTPPSNMVTLNPIFFGGILITVNTCFRTFISMTIKSKIIKV